MTKVLIIGSGPNVTQCRSWDRAPFDHILAINNAWQVRPDWDEMIHPEDFPENRRPTNLRPFQKITTAAQYVPAQNAYGGFVYAGGTMAFTAAYWALYTHRPQVIAYLGCDMVYPADQKTHFYGQGTPDPLRRDVTLQSLEAKSARLLIMAARQGCALVNLSTDPSRLIAPRATPPCITAKSPTPQPWDHTLADQADRREAALDYMVPSGRYWEVSQNFDAKALAEIDTLWLRAAGVDPRTMAVRAA